MISKYRLWELKNQCKLEASKIIGNAEREQRFLTEKENKQLTKLEEKMRNYDNKLWALKYHATRTEELDLPTWEEFKGSEKPVRFCGDDWEVYELGIRLNLNEIYLDLIEDYDEYTQKRYKATEGNYIKACDLCIKLFKGEE